MKTLRKSLHGHKDHHISSPIVLPSSLSKPVGSIVPPKKVIKALNSHKATAPQELSFEKGDFFHVLKDVNEQGLWYEAHNPMTGARGLVPAYMFEEFQKGAPTPRTPTTISPTRDSQLNGRPLSSPKTTTYYAVVVHDFAAERTDELEAKAGDTIAVVAQSNREWFVAKPIGRLGRPGLIPVSFVEIRDPSTGQPVEDVDALIDSGVLPRVEEWKQAMLKYKSTSIALGVLDEQSAPSILQVASQDPAINVVAPTPQYQPPANTSITRPATPKVLPEGILLSADVKSFHYETEEYWFRVNAVFQPYGASGSQPLPPARQLVLFRSYNDFYDFQVSLLDMFPHEAGRPDVSTRILPYMPGPAEQVDNETTMTRRAELDEYLHKLCELQRYARYILEHNLIRQFLALKPGDAEVEIAPRIEEIEALSEPTYADDQPDEAPDVDYEAERMERLRLSGRHEPSEDGSDYDEGADVMGRAYDGERYDYGHRLSSRASTGQDIPTTAPLRTKPRSASASVGSPGQQTGFSHSRAESMSAYRRPSQAPPRAVSPQAPQSYSRTSSPLLPSKQPGNSRTSDAARSYSSLEIDPYRQGSQSRSSLASSHDPSPVSVRSSEAASIATSATSASGGRSRSQSTAAHNPPISANNPQTAFVKIKIFDRVSDDLIAIRVHPQVTHAQLMDKVQARLGQGVLNLRYRDSLSNDLVGLEGDEDLTQWLESTDRHVLYAE
ncbi:hypothetical protein CERSUDRAFT_131629 [Gelatoporia subvermispora B]|uniref:Uncharacterized protein n=1 Tax=Ceriporiopsis subvermispora (strain B) TaxID=914234 RepID=M2RRM7_CERS8|nr:hypothetical protein CERSUDRAFT_131629 [Gelatoporia subvermispora B]